MAEKYDITQIPGYQSMNEEEKEFFGNYGYTIERQVELIEDEHTVKIGREFDSLLEDLAMDENEYIVESAHLRCSNGTTRSQTFRYKGKEIASSLSDFERTTMIMIHEDREERIGSRVPVNVDDCTGGLQDDINKDGKVNIVSLGNCKAIQGEEDLEKIIEDYGLKDKEEDIIQAIKEGKGTCYCFMRLNEEWENLPSAGLYATGHFQKMGADRLMTVTAPYMSFNGKEGITMMSMLFCNRCGGTIAAIESRQDSDFFDADDEPDRTNPKEVKEYMWNFFLEKGLSEIAVAGILGNVQCECQFNLVAAQGLNSNRFGLFQWSTNDGDDRRAQFDDWIKKQGKDINLISTQCEYAYIEMAKRGTIYLDAKGEDPALTCNYGTLRSASTPTEAALIFAAYFEGCYSDIGYPKPYYFSGEDLHYYDVQHRDDRVKFAIEIYDDMNRWG